MITFKILFLLHDDHTLFEKKLKKPFRDSNPDASSVRAVAALSAERFIITDMIIFGK